MATLALVSAQEVRNLSAQRVETREELTTGRPMHSRNCCA